VALPPIVELGNAGPAKHAELKTTSVYAHTRPGESSGRYLKTLNSLVQVANAKARGYRSLRNLAAITHLIAGKFDLHEKSPR
jgi:hypothetical protein